MKLRIIPCGNHVRQGKSNFAFIVFYYAKVQEV